MPTKSESSRNNGSKSHGPTSPEGKARSSQNALKHGLSSKQVLLPSESRDELDALRASYYDQFQPATAAEAELTETLAITRWRLRRLSSVEARLLENCLLEESRWMDDDIDKAGPEAHTAWAFARLAGRSSFLTLMRFETTLIRTYDRTLKHLQLLQSQRLPPAGPKLQNEPEPTSARAREDEPESPSASPRPSPPPSAPAPSPRPEAPNGPPRPSSASSAPPYPPQNASIESHPQKSSDNT